MSRAVKLLVLMSLVLLPLSNACAGQSDVIKELNQIVSAGEMRLDDWKYIEGDVPGAEKIDYDDSAWKSGNPEFEWGFEPIGWVRKKIVLPEKIGAFTIGDRVTLHMMVDDYGEVYINGKFIEKFHWDKGYVTLTQDAKPGDTFVVAVKIINTAVHGRLVWAHLKLHGLSQIGLYVQDYRLASSMLEFHKKTKGPVYEQALAKSLEDVDLVAARRGDTKTFLASLSKAQAALRPFGDVAAEYTCHLVGHAHIDMNWLWLWPETVEVCQNTFSTMIDLMDQYPEFTFSQSQATTYIAVQETMPDLFAEMKKRIKEGRWEITGGTWVEGDMNMASGESIVRQILYAKKYFGETFGKESEICWEPDTFGHPWTVPQILQKSGLKYYLFMRCPQGPMLFWWQAPEGSRVLTFNTHGYSFNIDEGIPEAVIKWADEINSKNYALLHGVGDHGGGPSRVEIERVLAFRNRVVIPKFKFSTAKSFFETVQKEVKDIPVLNQELNFTFQGCYTTHGDIKFMNRKSENLLPAAEAFSAIAGLYGRPYDDKGFRESWEKTCFNQFHDILPGSAIHGSYDYSRGLFEQTEAQASAELTASLKRIESQINTKGQGIPIVVFNPLSWSRTDFVEVEGPFPGENVDIRVVDSSGRSHPVQKAGDKVVFMAKDVPSMGYSVYWMRRGRAESFGAKAASDDNVCTMENEMLTVDVSKSSGAIVEVFDKNAKRQVMEKGKNSAVLQALAEAHVGMSAWEIGEIKSVTDLSTAESVEIVESGPVRSTVRVKHTHGSSSFAQDIMLHSGSPRIDIRMKADWQEVGSEEKGGTMMKAAFAVDVKDGKATFEIPFGAIERPANGDEVPAQKWIDLSNKDYGVSILNDCKYGHDVKDNTMRLTLLRCPYDPDPRPDVGMHEMTYSLYPHAGDWRKAGTVKRAYELNNPLIPLMAKAHTGPLGPKGSFLTVSPDNLIVTALKKSEGGKGLTLRFYESAGADAQAKITVPKGFKSWCETDLMEQNPASQGEVKRQSFSVPVGKYEIKTIVLQ